MYAFNDRGLRTRVETNYMAMLNNAFSPRKGQRTSPSLQLRDLQKFCYRRVLESGPFTQCPVTEAV